MTSPSCLPVRYLVKFGGEMELTYGTGELEFHGLNPSDSQKVIELPDYFLGCVGGGDEGSGLIRIPK